MDLLLENTYGPEERFQKAVEADEGFALPHALLAFTYMQKAQPAEARSSSARARELAASISRREQQQIEAVSIWTGGSGPDAMPIIHQHMQEFPRDIFMIRLAQRLYALGCDGAGIPDFPNHLFRLTKSVERENGDEWSYLGSNSFAHHEVGLVDEALDLAQRSLAIRPTNAVAAHSAAHSYFEMGDNLTGTSFLGTWLPGFDRRAQYHVHLSWHQALFELATGHYQRAFDLYESTIRPSVVAGNTTSLNDSAALMWRLQMYGGRMPPFPWDEVRDIAKPAATSPGPAFRDAHAALAFAGGGDQAGLSQLMDRLSAAANAGNPIVAEVSLPIAKGVSAFAHGEYAEAVAQLEPVFPQLARIGGSHAQREVFEDTLLEAYLRAEQFDKAEDMLRARLKKRETTRDLYRMAQAQESTGQLDDARVTLNAVNQAWQDADADSAELASVKSLAETIG
jgi:tetratricopeptide (TPR) repeat protein